MELLSTKKILQDAQKNKYALPAFNIHTLEILQSVLDGARTMQSPVIVATTPGTIKYIGLDYLIALFQVASNKENFPISFHLDHCQDVDFIKDCIKKGYRSVMIDASKESFDDNIKKTKEVVNFAHKYGVTVEAELGILSGVEDEVKVDNKDSMYTNPDKAVEFVDRTNVDSLAIAIGTAHGVYKDKPKIDFERLQEIRAELDIPLVLHGASGLSKEVVKKAISYGISKVNISTELKVPYAAEIRKYFNNHSKEYDPRQYLTPGKEVIKKVVIDKIRTCGSKSRA